MPCKLRVKVKVMQDGEILFAGTAACRVARSTDTDYLSISQIWSVVDVG